MMFRSYRTGGFSSVKTGFEGLVSNWAKVLGHESGEDRSRWGWVGRRRESTGSAQPPPPLPPLIPGPQRVASDRSRLD